MNRGHVNAGGRRWRTAIGLAAAAALIVAPGTSFGAEEGGGHSGGGHGGSGGGEDTSPGNNLSMPVIWTDVEGLRPTLREPTAPLTAVLGTLADGTVTPADATYVLKDDPATTDVVEQDPLFLQKTVNGWQAENVELADSGLALSGGRLPVTYLDWGDNLEAKDWSTRQMVRVETRLLQTVDGMTGYVMKKVFGQGQTEMWGVLGTPTPAEPPADPLIEPLPPTWNATEEQRTEAFAHTSNACLTIERIDRATSLSWDPIDRAWTADGKSVCVGDVTEGPGGYGAEVTVSGGMTFGYVWHAMGAEAGLYRLTFSLKPGAGVDIAPSTQLYPSATTEEGGHGHKPPGAGEEETTDPAAAEVTAEAGGGMGGSTGGSTTGGKPTPNVPVIIPELDLSYIDVGLDFSPNLPTMPLSLMAARAVEQITLTWQPPAHDGMGAVTEYVVNGVRDDDGAVLPEQRIAAGSPLTATYAGLVGGEPYTFTVAAVNGQGVGAAARVTSVPRIRPATAAPPASPPPAVAAPAAPKSATVRVKAVSGKSKLYVNVNPNKGKGYWQVMIQKKSGKVWKALPTVYRTKGSAETLTLDLPRGSYRAVVLPKYGRTGATSGSVALVR